MFFNIFPTYWHNTFLDIPLIYTLYTCTLGILIFSYSYILFPKLICHLHPKQLFQKNPRWKINQIAVFLLIKSQRTKHTRVVINLRGQKVKCPEAKIIMLKYFGVRNLKLGPRITLNLCLNLRKAMCGLFLKLSSRFIRVIY